MFLPPKVSFDLVKQFDQLWAANVYIRHDANHLPHIHFAAMGLD